MVPGRAPVLRMNGCHIGMVVLAGIDTVTLRFSAAKGVVEAVR